MQDHFTTWNYVQVGSNLPITQSTINLSKLTKKHSSQTLIPTQVIIISQDLLQSGETIDKVFLCQPMSQVMVDIGPRSKHLPGFAHHSVERDNRHLTITQENSKFIIAQEGARMRPTGKGMLWRHPARVEVVLLERCVVSKV